MPWALSFGLSPTCVKKRSTVSRAMRKLVSARFFSCSARSRSASARRSARVARTACHALTAPASTRNTAIRPAIPRAVRCFRANFLSR